VHLLEDVLGWAISFLASILMWITGYHEIDRIVSILILLIVGWNVLANLWRTFKVMMAATPDEKELKQIKQAISKIEGVVKIENVHYWSLDGEQNIFTARILVMAKSDAQIIRQQVSRILADFLIVDSTIELIEK
jgi:cobalt-zinc-cadmium efflux system protein